MVLEILDWKMSEHDAQSMITVCTEKKSDLHWCQHKPSASNECRQTLSHGSASLRGAIFSIARIAHRASTDIDIVDIKAEETTGADCAIGV